MCEKTEQICEGQALRTDALGIVVEDHPYDRGYWARFNGVTRDNVTWEGGQAGWDDCDDDVRREEAVAAGEEE
ncbi:hypothetical protein [Devosia lacusdianchii]|uniref:hypothetical protein n=1 Tax=Devosia lacusdianchii TaxID=2917991 RepID=UPI001F055D69|nr:hypothetical protein [Devosia sp. JXJ CY 41]